MIKANVGDKFPVVIKCFDDVKNGNDWDKFRKYGSSGFYGEQIDVGWNRLHSLYFNTSFHLDCYLLGDWEVQQVDNEHYIVGVENCSYKILVHKNCLKPIICKDCHENDRTMWLVRKCDYEIQEIIKAPNGLSVRVRDMTKDEIKKYIFDNEDMSDEVLAQFISNRNYIEVA